MATYTELYDLNQNDTMKNKVYAAITIAADLVRNGDDTTTDFDQTAGAHDARFAWVKNASAFLPSPGLVQKFWNAMLAANESASVAVITGASDSSIQTNVNKVVDILANGETA